MQVEDGHIKAFDLLELPSALLLSVLQYLDVQSLCYVSRTCKLLSILAAQPSLWPTFIHDGWAVWDVRCTVARMLRLPPQVFQVQVDVKRSRKFPVTVALHNLRPLLHITDTEGLADRLGKAVQEQVGRLSSSLWRSTSWQDYPPAASISVCRADRATVRASLRPEAVVPRLVHNLQQIGWPPSPQQTAALLAEHQAQCGDTGQMTSAAVCTGTGATQCIATAVYSLPSDQHAAGYDPGSIDRQSNDDQLCSRGHQEQHMQQSRREGPGWYAGFSSDKSLVNATCASSCLQVCRERCELMASGRLTQLSAAAQRSASPLSWEPRDRLELQRTPVSHLTAVDRLPDEQIARESAINQLQALGVAESAARQLAPAAIRLLHVSAAADPSMLAFSLPGKPGWLLMLDKAVKILARLHTLQQVCLCSKEDDNISSKRCGLSRRELQQHKAELDSRPTAAPPTLSLLVQQPPQQLACLLSADSAHMQPAWRQSGDRELQLCLAGLQEFAAVQAAGSTDLARLYRCSQMLEAAATEYAAEGAHMLSNDRVADAIRRMGLLKLQVEQEEREVMQQLLQTAAARDIVINRSSQFSGSECVLATGEAKVAMITHQMHIRSAMHVETLRALSWCLWLLGVVD